MKRIVLAMLLLLSPQPGAAAEDAFFQQSMAKLSGLAGFQCRFEQQMQFSDGGSQQYSGELAVRRPGMFRWQYQLPYEQLYVGDGSVIWHYEPDLMQAERLGNLESVDPVVMRLLDGRLSAMDINIVDKRDEHDGLKHYQVALESTAPVWLAFATDGHLRSIERNDVLGNINRMLLNNCAYIAPSKNLFSFSPPADVDVLDMRSQPNK